MIPGHMLGGMTQKREERVLEGSFLGHKNLNNQSQKRL